jgi:AraC-like DNA-binding protein
VNQRRQQIRQQTLVGGVKDKSAAMQGDGRMRCHRIAKAGDQPFALLVHPVGCAAAALSAMHGDIARDWTVASLARLCGVSRSKFATRFRDIVGMAPIEYLQHWRMAHAKDELRLGTKSIGTIALAMGFQSLSAFSTAFTRVVGCSPRRFAGPWRA